MLIDEIKSMLEKHGYEIDPDVIGRIETMVESIRDDNQLYKLDHIIKWFNEKRKGRGIFSFFKGFLAFYGFMRCFRHSLTFFYLP